MYVITATHVTTKAPFQIDLDSASLDDLANVFEPAKLPAEHRNRYFARQKDLKLGAIRETRFGILSFHDLRLSRILRGLQERAIGPPDDAVHETLKEVTAEVTAILKKWRLKIEADVKDNAFKELALATELRGSLQRLRAHLADDAADAEHLRKLERARNQVGDALARGEAGVRAYVGGAGIGYRGSLATGWRNAMKSDHDVAQRIDLLKFDSDAFVDVPAATWEAWQGLNVVTQIEKEGKMNLNDLIKRTKDQIAGNKLTNDNGTAAREAALDRILNQLQGVEKVEEQLKLAMKSVGGYKKLEPGDDADFSFVLQSSKKTARELKAGNLYPLDEIARAGLPLTETDLELVFEDGKIRARMPEHHRTMTKPVTTRTYAADVPADPHTLSRPTEAMLIEAYFKADVPAPLNRQPSPTPTPLGTHLVRMGIDSLEIERVLNEAT